MPPSRGSHLWLATNKEVSAQPISAAVARRWSSINMAAFWVLEAGTWCKWTQIARFKHNDSVGVLVFGSSRVAEGKCLLTEVKNSSGKETQRRFLAGEWRVRPCQDSLAPLASELTLHCWATYAAFAFSCGPDALQQVYEFQLLGHDSFCDELASRAQLTALCWWQAKSYLANRG